MTDRLWNGWAVVRRGKVWHRVEHLTVDGAERIVLWCTGQTDVGRRDVRDYRWLPDVGSRCERCAPAGWQVDEP